jgi:hypothetical protein
MLHILEVVSWRIDQEGDPCHPCGLSRSVLATICASATILDGRWMAATDPSSPKIRRMRIVSADPARMMSSAVDGVAGCKEAEQLSTYRNSPAHPSAKA